MLRKHFSPTVILALVLCVSVLTSCSSEWRTGRNEDGVLTRELSSSYTTSTLALIDGRMIYTELGNNGATFFSLDIESNKRTEIGFIPEYVMSANCAQLSDNSLYLYVTMESEDGDRTNNLMQIDYEGGQLRCLSSDNKCSPMIALYGAQQELIAIKVSASGNGESWIERLDPESGKVLDTVNASKQETFVIGAVAGTELDVLAYQELGQGNYKFFIKRYNLDNLKEFGSISLDNIHDYISEARIGEFERIGNYLYFENYSNKSLIAKIDEDAVEEIMQEDNLALASGNPDYTVHDAIFYVRRTDSCFSFDPETGTTEDVDLDLSVKDYIRSIFTDGEQILVKEKQSSEVKQKENDEYLLLYDSTALFNVEN